MVILDKNIFLIEPEQIIDTKVTHTIIGGDVMYSIGKSSSNYFGRTAATCKTFRKI